jgi:hypothetical protein
MQPLGGDRRVDALQFLPPDGYRQFVARGLERLRALIPEAGGSVADSSREQSALL